MGGVCGEDFEAALGGADLQDGSDDEEIGGKYDHMGVMTLEARRSTAQLGSSLSRHMPTSPGVGHHRKSSQ